MRIFVNKEITELVNGIISATKILKPGGKILVINFHSIEDKIIKYLFTKFSENKQNHLGIFQKIKLINQFYLMNIKNKVLRPSKKGAINSRSRSTKLRFATRSKNNFEYRDLIKRFKDI